MKERTWTMEYDTPAEVWEEALPMGNGRLGAMVYGHTAVERIQLNEDSLWYGEFVNRNNPATKETLPLIREKVLSGQMREAEDLIAQYMVGAPNTMRHYEPLGELDIALNQHTPFIQSWIPNSDGARKYHSCLNLMTGIYTLTHCQSGVTYTREMFVSHPAQVLCIRIRAEKPNTHLCRFKISLHSVRHNDFSVIHHKKHFRAIFRRQRHSFLRPQNKTGRGKTITGKTVL
ncbi:MAG: glycoside hydrolase family 95 protein [Lachnospiraceae bacterium]|nr:glycoside hydrolase family 95 protein [Lachnospiraceae bacterium]